MSYAIVDIETTGTSYRNGKITEIAILIHDGQNLYVAIVNDVDPAKPLRMGPTWGQDDAVEVAVMNPAAGKNAPIFVLRGYPNGHFESSDEAGTPAAAVKKAGEAVMFAAKVIDKGHWSAEYCIPFAALGIVWGVVVIFTRFFRAKPDSPPPAAPSVKPLLLLQDEDAESEITTVIVSALAAALEAPPGGIRVRAIRAITDPTPSWGKAGRMEELNSSL